MQSSDDKNEKKLTKISQVRGDKEIGRLEQDRRNNDDIPVKMTTEDDIGNMRSLTKALDSTIIPLRWIILSRHERNDCKVYQRCGNIQWSWGIRSLQARAGRTDSISVQRDQVSSLSSVLSCQVLSISESLRRTEARRNTSSPPVMFEKLISKHFCSLKHGGAMITLLEHYSHDGLLFPTSTQWPVSTVNTVRSQCSRTRNRNYQQIYITQCLEASVESREILVIFCCDYCTLGKA